MDSGGGSCVTSYLVQPSAEGPEPPRIRPTPREGAGRLPSPVPRANSTQKQPGRRERLHDLDAARLSGNGEAEHASGFHRL